MLWCVCWNIIWFELYLPTWFGQSLLPNVAANFLSPCMQHITHYVATHFNSLLNYILLTTPREMLWSSRLYSTAHKTVCQKFHISSTPSISCQLRSRFITHSSITEEAKKMAYIIKSVFFPYSTTPPTLFWNTMDGRKKKRKRKKYRHSNTCQYSFPGVNLNILELQVHASMACLES